MTAGTHLQYRCNCLIHMAVLTEKQPQHLWKILKCLDNITNNLQFDCSLLVTYIWCHHLGAYKPVYTHMQIILSVFLSIIIHFNYFQVISHLLAPCHLPIHQCHLVAWCHILACHRYLLVVILLQVRRWFSWLVSESFITETCFCC